jgi:hypothetical protein
VRALRCRLAIIGLSLTLVLGGVALPARVPVAIAAPADAQSADGGGFGIPNPLAGLASMLSPDNLGKLIQDTATFLLRQMVSGLHDLLLGLTQGDDTVITHTPPGMTYQQGFVVDKHDALVRAMDWGFVAALAVTGLLVMLGPSSPLSYPVAGEVVPRLVIAYLAAHSSLQWGAWFIDLSNALCTAVAPADPFPLTATADPGSAFALLGLALVYGLMALFLSLFMFARVQLIAALLILAPAAAALWVLPGRPRQWAELWLDLFFSNLFVQFIQVLVLNLGVQLLQTAGGDALGFRQFLSGAAALLLVFRVPALVAAGVGGGATSFLGLVALFRGLQHLGLARMSLQLQQTVAQASSATWTFVRHPRASITQEWQGMASSPAGRAVRGVGRVAGSAAERVRDEAVVRRGV